MIHVINGFMFLTDDIKAKVSNSYFNSVNADNDGTLPDFPHRESKIQC